MKSTRIVVCIDVQAATEVEAYVKLARALIQLAPQGIEWESTDEWYYANGDPIPVRVVEDLCERGHDQLYGELS